MEKRQTRIHLSPKALVVCLGILLCSLVSKISAQTLQIDPLKANYIEGFLDFVRWEEAAHKESITIGVIGQENFSRLLARLATETQQTKTLEIKRLGPDESMEGIDVLFVGTGFRNHWEAIHSICREESILTIGEEEGFVESGGSIEFTVKRNRLRFIVSQENARNSGIELSSKLVELSIE